MLSFVAQAKDWESQGEYERAIESYLKVTPQQTQDIDFVERAWQKVLDRVYTVVHAGRTTICDQLIRSVPSKLPGVDKPGNPAHGENVKKWRKCTKYFFEGKHDSNSEIFF